MTFQEASAAVDAAERVVGRIARNYERGLLTYAEYMRDMRSATAVLGRAWRELVAVSADPCTCQTGACRYHA